MKQYPSNKPSGVDWIGEIPSHWTVKRLKYVALSRPSNIDKKSVEGEKEVLLCNYTDVYKNEFITDALPLMKATATDEQISKFCLEKGDVLATKDSEDPKDIAVPAVVKETLPGVVCGYHLTHIKPDNSQLNGFYLFRLFQSYTFNQQFTIRANGITRYGLSSEAFSGAYLPLPPKKEQQVIANYLDEKTSLIDATIQKKQRLIELLQEERTALINQAVTRGLNPDVKLKPSGVEWLGDVPEHWEVSRLKFLSKITTGAKNTEDRVGEGIYPFFVRSQTIERINTFSFDGEAILTAGDGVGVGKVFHYYNGKLDFHQRVYLLYDFESVLGKLLFHYIQANLNKEVFRWNAKSTVDSLRLPMFQNFMVAFPPSIKEQEELILFVEGSMNKIDQTITKIEKEISLLQEYRIALINEVVTGKRCVIDFGDVVKERECSLSEQTNICI